MGRITTRRNVTRVRGDTSSTRPDTLVVEEPLEIRLGGRSLAVTMRTPGNDFELAAGFLTTEGVITSAADITDQRYCTGARPDTQYNIVNVTLAPGVRAPDPSVERAFYTTSSCGICGKGSIDAVHTVASWRVAEDPAPVAGSVLAELPDLLRRHQAVFERTGGLHAAGLFSTGGELLCLREDVGRHNAVDKVIGWACARDMLPLRGCVLQVSGRASFELVQKALMAGIPVMSAVSAPSSLAVDLAAESGITLAGFVRGETMNIYTGGHRIRTEPSETVSGPGSLAATIS